MVDPVTKEHLWIIYNLRRLTSGRITRLLSTDQWLSRMDSSRVRPKSPDLSDLCILSHLLQTISMGKLLGYISRFRVGSERGGVFKVFVLRHLGTHCKQIQKSCYVAEHKF